MRYVGQGHEIRVPLPDAALGGDSASGIIAEFERVYRELYGRLGPPVPIEVINWRVMSSGLAPELHLQTPAGSGGDAGAALKGHRAAYFPELGGYHDTPVYDRYALAPGAMFDGPAIVEERESTVIVGPKGTCRVDEQRNLVIEL
jgi:N-methylhydantoinase A